MQLAEFIESNIEPILLEWEAFARGLLPGKSMTVIELRDDAESILRHTARDMRIQQSPLQQANKSKGQGGQAGEESDALDQASSLHGTGRVGSGFHVNDVVAEYRALRASVLRLWSDTLRQPDLNDIEEIKRFDESLDQSLASAVASYSKRADESRQMFLAILSHDLRNPLGCIRMASQLVTRKGADAATADAMSMIGRSTETSLKLISDLIDYASSGLGRTMPLHRELISMAALCRDVADGFRTTYPNRTLTIHSENELVGMWDATRMRQVIFNLLGNAIQHGSPEGPIDLSMSLDGTTPEDSAVVIRVHNEGAPIPPDVLPTIFDPLKRYATRESAAQRKPGSIGLGLFIVREIIVSKGGSLKVESTAKDGTTFTVRIPRFLPAESDYRDETQPAK